MARREATPVPGGYGAVLMYGDKRKELYRLPQTTNNRMELMGAIAALEALKKPGLSVTLYTDSQYIVKAINEGWLNKWLATNFAKGKKNKDLWVRFYNLFRQHSVKFVWVKAMPITRLTIAAMCWQPPLLTGKICWWMKGMRWMRRTC